MLCCHQVSSVLCGSAKGSHTVASCAASSCVLFRTSSLSATISSPCAAFCSSRALYCAATSALLTGSNPSPARTAAAYGDVAFWESEFRRVSPVALSCQQVIKVGRETEKAGQGHTHYQHMLLWRSVPSHSDKVASNLVFTALLLAYQLLNVRNKQ